MKYVDFISKSFSNLPQSLQILGFTVSKKNITSETGCFLC